jgi:hypothetical protein
VANPKQVHGVNNVLRDAPPREETRLVRVHEGVNGKLEPSRKDFSDSFHDTVLEGDGTKLGWVAGRLSLGDAVLKTKEKVLRHAPNPR